MEIQTQAKAVATHKVCDICKKGTLKYKELLEREKQELVLRTRFNHVCSNCKKGYILSSIYPKVTYDIEKPNLEEDYSALDKQKE